MTFELSALNIFLLMTTIIVILVFIPWIFKRERKRLPSEHVQQRETDLRLTYKRFMELYPYSKISYQEYKQMQARHAYKKAVSSMKIKRMVR